MKNSQIKSKLTNCNSFYCLLTWRFKKVLNKSFLRTTWNKKDKKYDEILALAIFFFIAITFKQKHTKKRPFNFYIGDYFQDFSKKNILNFLKLSIAFFNEEGKKKNKILIASFNIEVISSFKEQFFNIIEQKKIKSFYLNNYDELFSCIQTTVKIIEIFQSDFKKYPEKVVDLIELIQTWKKQLFKLYGYFFNFILNMFINNLKFK